MGYLYYKDLHQQIFLNYPKNATDLFIVSAYVGAHPVQELASLPLNTTLIYGYQKDVKKRSLDNVLKDIHIRNNNISILFSRNLVHSKMYLWFKNEEPLKALIGSANFSDNGLKTPYKETLLEVERPDIYSLHAYFKIIKNKSILCTETADLNLEEVKRLSDHCELILYEPKTGKVQEKSALNWGFSKGHVYKDDAYIRISKEDIKLYPKLFLPKVFNPEEGHRSRRYDETVELIWDDGTIMECLFEGTQKYNNEEYPKQIASVGKKRILGEYIRKRLGKNLVSDAKLDNERITREDLENYGRTSISLNLISPGVYSANFSPQ